MINENVLFVIGAGASVDYGFPIGKKLLDNIINKLDNSSFLRDLTDNIGITRAKIQSFKQHVQESRLDSIDIWLQHNPSYGQIGRICIADEILRCERKFRHTNGWFESFWKKFVSETNFAALCSSPPNNIMFITFNYDRLIERLFRGALCSTFAEPISKVQNREANIMRIISPNVMIRHVYGKCGKLEWQDSSDQDLVCKFGEDIRGDKLADIAQKVSIVGQEVAPNPRYYNHIISKFGPRKIFFLGFGYGSDNLNLITNSFDSKLLIYGTSIGFTNRDINNIVGDLSRRYNTRNIKIFSSFNCGKLLDQYL